MSRALLVVAALCLASPAHADDPPSGPSAEEQKSLQHYQKGVTAYDLGKFDEAVQQFQRAYEVKPTPAYLYNIAQAHRQKGDARKALFFYRRYLQKAPAASNRETVVRRIGELQEQLRKQEDARPARTREREPSEPIEKPPAAVAAAPPAPPAPASRAAPARARIAADSSVARAAPPARSRLRLALEAGPAFISLGDGPDVPVQVAVGAGVAYTVYLGGVALDLGVAGSLTPVPFETLERDADGTALVIAALGNLGLRFPIARRLALRAEAGGGVALWTGLRDRNPFTDGGAESDTLTMPHLRAALGLDYALGASLRLTLTPAFAWSAAPDSLDDRISSITRLDVLAGVAVTL
jgi:tetratricopeptide (TPR) repeat protein